MSLRILRHDAMAANNIAFLTDISLIDGEYSRLIPVVLFFYYNTKANVFQLDAHFFYSDARYVHRKQLELF